MTQSVDTIGIIGAGAWGTALALVARRAGRKAILWAHETETVAAIRERRENPFLPGVKLDPEIAATTDMKEAAAADAILLVPPAQHLRPVAAALAPHVKKNIPIVICAKGIESKTGALMSDALAAAMPHARTCVLSGPTFATEVARGLPTAVTLASADETAGAALARALASRHFRIYRSDDVIGAQLGGAVKNVIAIACGVVMGRGLGDNARAALITRGLAEIARLGRAMGAKPETIMGLSGLGDLALTCTGEQSRNLSLGMALGRGETIADILAKRRSVAEGVATAGSVVTLAARHGVEMPIAAAVDAVANKGADIDATIAALLARPSAQEEA
ncbi:MAG: NAD(P)H-dependent glycerol-3-phosphate dehydrogenase [Alphaproteobacteria bacterium]